MRYKGKRVNLDNYKEIFQGCSKDTLDVIRSAILDDTTLGTYIDRYKNNPYLLWQVKLALDEELDTKWFSLVHSGSMLQTIRELNSKGLNLEPLKVIFSKRLPKSYYPYIVEWYSSGVPLSEYNFSILPSSMLTAFDRGIKLGYPMYVFNNGKTYTEEYMFTCMKINSNNRSISVFLEGGWDLAVLELLATYSKTRYYSILEPVIKSSISVSLLEEFYKCSKQGMPLKDIAIISENGAYLYEPYQVAIIRDAFSKKYDYFELLDPELSMEELCSKFNSLEMANKPKKRIAGRLKK